MFQKKLTRIICICKIKHFWEKMHHNKDPPLLPLIIHKTAS